MQITQTTHAFLCLAIQFALLIYMSLVGEHVTRADFEIPGTRMAEAADWTSANNWITSNFSRPENSPFSFSYDDIESKQFLSSWSFSSTETKLDKRRTLHTYIFLDPKTGLEARCEAIVFKDFPAVEWVLHFRNTSAYDTPIISKVRALDATWKPSQTKFILHHAKGVQEGVDAQVDDFRPMKRILSLDSSATFSPLHGRPSWGESLPFFNLEMLSTSTEAQTARGVVVSVGWTGQWFAHFSRQEKSLNARAGMEKTHLKLHPGEEIRTPKIMLLFWQGHRLYGQNLLRRMILAHYYPQRGDKPITMPFLGSSAGLYREAFEATETNQLDYAKKMKRLGIEYLWMDVGWHDLTKPHTHLGPISPSRFPRGFRPLTDKLRKMNMGILVWMAPEFQGGGSWMEREYPEMFLTINDETVADSPIFKIMNFGDKNALELLTNHISTFLNREGISIYRQDGPIGSNLPHADKQPLRWWRDNDTPDRQGINEIRYVEGMYWFWDELRKRNPGLIIDSCGGGATRIDLESMSRCVYLWRSDSNHPGFEPNGHQSQTYGVSQWIPSTSTGSGYPDTYSFRSAMNNGLALAWNPYQPEKNQAWSLASPVEQEAPYSLTKVTRKTVDGKERTGYVPSEPFPWNRAQRLTTEFLRIRDYFQGDFYPLTPYSVKDNTWMAYQLHNADEDCGVILAFRRGKNPHESLKVKLWDLVPEKTYRVRFEDSSVVRKLTGRELSEDLTISIDSQPGSVLVTYRPET